MPWAAWRAERPRARGPPGPWHIPGHRGDDGGAAGGGVIGDPRVFFVPFLSLLSFRQRTRSNYCCRQEKSISLGQQIHLGEKFQSPTLLCVGHEIVPLLFSLGSARVCPRPGGGLGRGGHVCKEPGICGPAPLSLSDPGHSPASRPCRVRTWPPAPGLWLTCPCLSLPPSSVPPPQGGPATSLAGCPLLRPHDPLRISARPRDFAPVSLCPPPRHSPWAETFSKDYFLTSASPVSGRAPGTQQMSHGCR